MQDYRDKPVKRINGFDARVLDQHKTISFSHEDGSFSQEVPVNKRVSKGVIAGLAKAHKGVEKIYVRHYRYCVYNLRTVMSQRSGGYTNLSIYTIEDGEIKSVKREIKNEMC